MKKTLFKLSPQDKRQYSISVYYNEHSSPFSIYKVKLISKSNEILYIQGYQLEKYGFLTKTNITHLKMFLEAFFPEETVSYLLSQKGRFSMFLTTEERKSFEDKILEYIVKENEK